jgi:hypothetical protein
MIEKLIDAKFLKFSILYLFLIKKIKQHSKMFPTYVFAFGVSSVWTAFLIRKAAGWPKVRESITTM